MRAHQAVLATLTTLAVLACTPAASEMSAEDIAADKAAIDAVRDREMAAINAGNMDSALAVYADDVDMMAPGAPAAHGSQAVRDLLTAMLSEMTPNGSYTSSTVEVSGDWAIDRYTASMTMTPKAGGEAMTETIKGVHILRRQADGTWKIAHDVWNADAPMPPAPMPAGKQ